MNTSESFLSRLLIVIVVYRQKISETNAFRTLIPDNSPLNFFIYDNSPEPQQPPATSHGIVYNHDSTNSGVSKAYNIASAHAKTSNKKWLLLVDQDTCFPDFFLNSYQQAVRRFAKSELFCPLVRDSKGVLSPFLFSQGKGKRLSSVLREGTYDLRKFKFINSGLLVSLDLFEKAGGYDERFALDYSDIVFIDRLLTISSTFILVDIFIIQDFSGLSRTHLPSAIERFKSFCSSMSLYKEKIKPRLPLNRVLLSRALKLSLQHLTIQFLQIAFGTLRKRQ